MDLCPVNSQKSSALESSSGAKFPALKGISGSLGVAIGVSGMFLSARKLWIGAWLMSGIVVVMRLGEAVSSSTGAAENTVLALFSDAS